MRVSCAKLKQGPRGQWVGSAAGWGFIHAPEVAGARSMGENPFLTKLTGFLEISESTPWKA